MENPIGKRVHRIVGGVMLRTTYKVIKVIDFKESNDYCEHYIIENVRGKKRMFEVRKSNLVFVPNNKLPEDERIREFLCDNDCFTDEVYQISSNVFAMRVNGDWRHTHEWCKILMSYLGYKFKNEVPTSYTNSDWGESIHYYYKAW